EGEGEVVRGDSAAVVDHPDEFSTAGLEVDVDASGAGVDRVLEEFLDDARRPFDHLARRDLRDHVRRQLADAGLGHESLTLRASSALRRAISASASSRAFLSRSSLDFSFLACCLARVAFLPSGKGSGFPLRSRRSRKLPSRSSVSPSSLLVSLPRTA